MTPMRRVLLVLAGYGCALAVAVAMTWLWVWWTDGPDAQASSGMHAFGDLAVFLIVLVLASLPATAFALYSLRTVHAFWSGVTALVLGLDATNAVCAGALVLTSIHAVQPQGLVGFLSGIGILRVLGGPLLAPVWVVTALFAPRARTRAVLLASAAAELVLAALALGLIWRTTW